MERRSGVLLHISSLNSKYGVGTLGKEAYKFVDWLEKAGCKLWQVLPLTPTGYGDSPYQSVSSFALNYYYIDLDILKDKGLLKEEDYKDVKFNYVDNRVDFELLFYNKIPVLKKAFSNFNTEDPKFKEFGKIDVYDEFALFMTLKELHDFNEWAKWFSEFKTYSKEMEDKIKKLFNKNYLFWLWTQYEFLDEWTKLKKYANDKGIEIIGDMPIYVAYDSVEVWKYPELFLLNPDRTLRLVAGCPPDCFTEDGQLWGNPVYDWEAQKKDGYKWYSRRISEALKLYDILRIDHFRGFSDFYAIPAKHVTAKFGFWMEGPRFELFKDKLNLSIIAEDLGFVDEPLKELMKQVKYPGMKILEFAFDGHKENEHKPSNYNHNFVVYTGTHDNMPIFQHITDLPEDARVAYEDDIVKECKKLGIKANVSTVDKMIDSIIELGLASVADTVIYPIQDLLHLDGSSRMNLPATLSKDNWSYRISDGDLSAKLAKQLKELNTKYQR
ncbi:MAG: 4-alpha-glucanotransferase [Acholeplasmatales bacterium]|nr:4-alpha-glucanotransferase [Acholeplasmatales bacterium]